MVEQAKEDARLEADTGDGPSNMDIFGNDVRDSQEQMQKHARRMVRLLPSTATEEEMVCRRQTAVNTCFGGNTSSFCPTLRTAQR
eukprot:COSAG01_NODE_5061_length_4518_cov_17.546277_8_plen_85_part_00